MTAINTTDDGEFTIVVEAAKTLDWPDAPLLSPKSLRAVLQFVRAADEFDPELRFTFVLDASPARALAQRLLAVADQLGP